MATNYESKGCIIDHLAASDISSGDVVEMGALVGVAQIDIATGDVGAVAVAGVYEVTKTAGTAWVQGEHVTPTAGSFAPGVGLSVAAMPALSAATTGLVLLNGNSG